MGGNHDIHIEGHLNAQRLNNHFIYLNQVMFKIVGSCPFCPTQNVKLVKKRAALWICWCFHCVCISTTQRLQGWNARTTVPFPGKPGRQKVHLQCSAITAASPGPGPAHSQGFRDLLLTSLWLLSYPLHAGTYMAPRCPGPGTHIPRSPYTSLQSPVV